MNAAAVPATGAPAAPPGECTGSPGRVASIASAEAVANAEAVASAEQVASAAAAATLSPRVTAVVVAYHAEAWLDACLRALLATRYPTLRVLVVDNGGDGYAAAVAAQHGERVRLLKLDRNYGFAGGANRAVATLGGDTDSTDIVALVNQDCVVDPDWLAPLVSALSGDATVGVVGARLLDSDGVTLQHAGGVVAANGLTAHLGRGERAPDAFCETRDVDYVCGALIALRMDTWRRFGPFDEGYFPAYFEEVDLCVRVRAGSMRVLYVPGSRACHAEAASSQGASSRVYLRRYHRSRLRFVARHMLRDGGVARWLRAEMAWLLRLRRWSDVAPVLGAYATLPRLLLSRHEAFRP